MYMAGYDNEDKFDEEVAKGMTVRGYMDKITCPTLLVTGEFDPNTYQAALRQQGITDAILRRDIADGLLNQQVLRPAFAAPRLPRAAARHYAALVLERRQGTIGRIPSSLFAPSANPTVAAGHGPR